MMTYRKERDRNLLVAGRWSWMSHLGCACGVSPVPLVPQEIVRLPLQSSYVNGK
ncbi:hypothetical protein [Rossellomorea aquimaris]|uniref:hypothetical protein n=1 Tax=Rossellomorea aquimaris TaxID=189382 RepID=UPI0016539553|nr:hypothetical protein [Rossellomorea aquimaris]